MGTTRAHIPKEHSKESSDHNYKIGDKVTIRNLYQGLRGTKGTVTHITKTQLSLVDRSGKTHKRKYANVSKSR